MRRFQVKQTSLISLQITHARDTCNLHVQTRVVMTVTKRINTPQQAPLLKLVQTEIDTAFTG